MIRAIIKRWWYLLTYGMWQGYCSVTLWQGHHIIVIGIGVPTKTPGVFQPYRIFWQRRAHPPQDVRPSESVK